ncbi:redoxin domain-containing protein [Tenacibaculum aestuariivivum]|uniref:redoxin domain-containing protein n=1 Tax=Tenacibaculum aestuariivivum TaxID=2006131 RepID=UPI003AB31487
MKKLLSLLVFATSIVSAQYTVKGTMTPPEKSDWVYLHKLEGAKPKFISNTTIKFDTIVVGGEKQILGKFDFELPEDAKTGAYRATYRNKGAGFVDFYFNKENIEFIFNPKYPDQSVVFTASRENKLYSEYLQAYALIQNKIDEQQVAYIKNGNKEAKKEYKKAVDELEDVQKIYKNKSDGMLVHNFIKASQRYNSSSPIDNMDEYLSSTVNNFFKNIDFKNNALYNSSFLIDRITDYVFYLNFSNDQDLQQKLYKESITKVMDEISTDKLRKATIEFLITSFADKRNGELVDWLFENYYDTLPENQIDIEFKKEKVQLLLATVGRTAPDFSWKEGDKELKLSTLNDAQEYLLVFWSTSCPHCTKDIPELHSYMKKNHEQISLITFGIEDNELDWTEFVKNLPYSHNAIGTHPEYKFDNETVRKYNLLGTPTYFVLDKDKKIISMPNDLVDVKKYFETPKPKKVEDEE